MSERTLLLGFDLGDEKSQMAVYDREKMEPVLIGQTEENPEALIDTEIALEGMEPLTDSCAHSSWGGDCCGWKNFSSGQYAVLLFS